MSAADALGGMRDRYARLAGRMQKLAFMAPPERERLRQELEELASAAEAALADVLELKERIRGLAHDLGAAPPVQACVRVDHLGSATFVEQGWSLLANGEYAEAAERLHRALELAPRDIDIETMLGWALMRAGRYDAATLTLDGVLAREPAHALARASVGYVRLKQGDFAGALEQLSGVLSAGADRKASLYANFYLGLLYLEREMYCDAKSYLASALELAPNLIEAWWQLGRACYLEGNPADAGRAWRHGAETGRYTSWGDRCRRALERLDGEASAAAR
jgi:tetratricopeptide (TPR) repeat protein